MSVFVTLCVLATLLHISIMCAVLCCNQII